MSENPRVKECTSCTTEARFDSVTNAYTVTAVGNQINTDLNGPVSKKCYDGLLHVWREVHKQPYVLE